MKSTANGERRSFGVSALDELAARGEGTGRMRKTQVVGSLGRHEVQRQTSGGSQSGRAGRRYG